MKLPLSQPQIMIPCGTLEGEDHARLDGARYQPGMVLVEPQMEHLDDEYVTSLPGGYKNAMKTIASIVT